ncbi:MAG: Crp/Fnr family transcriptional regulator, partial [candidate division Zixibacteria bacterium]|nr:Crp/Fnr family transcriptional regulator [candidate division Zixibacteria bacterium]
SIPESFVLGGVFLAMLTANLASGSPSFGDIVPFTLIAGLFLSNLPEAMSSSVGMRAQGWSAAKILGLWLSLAFMVVVSTVIGYILGAQLDHTVMVAVEGLAAGAMLTMIAQTMIPEAVHLGSSNTVGLSTLTGFLSAVAFKLLEV